MNEKRVQRKAIKEIKRKEGQQCNNNRLTELGLWDAKAKTRYASRQQYQKAKGVNSDEDSKLEKSMKLKEVLSGRTLKGLTGRAV